MNTYAIEVKGLRKSFVNQAVLNGVDVTIQAGTVFALLGPNGAGKTTLISILSTLMEPDAGCARVAGFDVVKEKERVKSSISLTGQYAAVDEVLTAVENLQMMGRLSGLSAREARRRANELLEYFDLIRSAHKRVKTYSGGMRRRLDLAISLVVDRPILFLDEPTTGLDTRSRRALWRIIKDLKERGITVFLTTQYLEEADELADTIAVMNDGKIVARGTAEELKSEIGGEVVELRNEEDELIGEFPTDGSIQGLRHVLSSFTHNALVGTRVSIRKPSMDDVFLKLTEKNGRVHNESAKPVN